MTLEQAEAFADEWVDAWNTHDLDRNLTINPSWRHNIEGFIRPVQQGEELQ